MRQQLRDKPHWVYLFISPNCLWFKIGMTSNLKLRERQLQLSGFVVEGGHGRDGKFVETVALRNQADAQAYEELMHGIFVYAFGAKRIPHTTDWFSMSGDPVQKFRHAVEIFNNL